MQFYKLGNNNQTNQGDEMEGFEGEELDGEGLKMEIRKRVCEGIYFV
jgi:hypothetical protein